MLEFVKSYLFCVYETPAEKLLLLAENIAWWKEYPDYKEELKKRLRDDKKLKERIALTMKFAKSPPVLQFRAIFEEWDIHRIVKELQELS